MFFKRSKYQIYLKRYGKPILTAFCEHVWQQASEKFVRDAKTGKIVERTREVKYLGSNENRTVHFYLSDKSKLTAVDIPKPSFTE